jgi:hypothetical protein
MTEPRHLLVLASQCERMAPLALLESAATELHGVLADPALGACLPGLRDGRSLCVGTLVAEQVRAEVREAVEYAESAGATLVLALLGHGFVPGNANDLHMMVSGSREGDTLSSVSVSRLFADAVDRLGSNGVIGIVDTCSAAGAIPDLGRLLQGNAAGRTRIALLMAAAVQQSAVEFRLARGLAGLLSDGVLGADRFLDVPLLHQELRRSAVGHRLVRLDYDGSFPGAPLWLGHNRRHESSTVSSSGRTALREALTRLTPPCASPATWSIADLDGLQNELAARAETPATAWALRVVDSLLVAMRTTVLLQSLLPDVLDTPRLRRAMATAGVSIAAAATTATDDLTAIVERVALAYPALDKTCRPQVARFVMALVGAAGKPFDPPEITTWARSINATVQVNDAAGWARQHSQTKRLRLIVSLHASNTGDWPELLETWLLLDGKLDDDGRRRIPCTADKAGVEKAIVAALDLAEERADLLGLRLDHVDIAVPSKLLLEWQPEKIERGQWIGTDFTVVMRWSERLNPPKEMRRLNRRATHRLEDIDAYVGGPPVDWLDHLDVRDLPTLREKLVRGRYRRAIALDRRPQHGERLLSLLLAHVPILLWPQPTWDHPIEDHACLDVCWDRLPDELILAYRREWRDEGDEPIAKLRAVWDDKEWLDFCRSYQGGISG